MQLLSELGVVNQCLATMGEAPLTSINAASPYVVAALSLLQEETLAFQVAGWWFNKEVRTIQPNVNGEVYLPANCIEAYTSILAKDYIKRGSRMYSLQSNSYNIGKPLELTLVTALRFEELPVVAQRVVACRVAFEFQNKFVASSSSAALLKQRLDKAETEFLKEHVKLAKTNFMNSGSIGLKRAKLKGYVGLSTLRGV